MGFKDWAQAWAFGVSRYAVFCHDHPFIFGPRCVVEAQRRDFYSSRLEALHHDFRYVSAASERPTPSTLNCRLAWTNPTAEAELPEASKPGSSLVNLNIYAL